MKNSVYNQKGQKVTVYVPSKMKETIEIKIQQIKDQISSDFVSVDKYIALNAQFDILQEILKKSKVKVS